MVIHQLALTLTLDFFLLSEVVTMQQTDGVAYKLKPRLFHKSTHLWVYSADFHPSVNCVWQIWKDKVKVASAYEHFSLLTHF